MKTNFNFFETTMNSFQAQFHKLLELQNATNTKISGTDWRIRASSHAEIDFAMAALDELHEFVVSAFHWKWWGKSPDLDCKNALMELVDILHFGISEDLVRSGSGENDGDQSVSNRMAVGYKEAESSFSIMMSLDEIKDDDAEKQIAFKVFVLKETVKKLYISFSSSGSVVDWTSFWFALLIIGGNFDSVNKVYLGKAVLNKFRQDHGYKQGTYKKSWKIASPESETVNTIHKEDNQVLMEWLDLQADYTEDSIHAFLETTYHTILN